MTFPIDHIVYAAPNLETGMDTIEALLGVRPVKGGRHPLYGTHNALLSLGDSIYLEIIAPDPGLEAPANGRLLQEHFGENPHIATWVLRSAQIEKDAAFARKNGVMVGRVSSGQREKPDGTILSWQLTDPYALPFDGAIPFLISWGKTPHPAGSVPKAGQLIGLAISHPDAPKLIQQLDILGIHTTVTSSREVKIKARIQIDERIVMIE